MVLIIIFSFLLDGIISNFININSLFYPLLSLVCFVVIYPYVNESFFYKSSIVTGIFYDLLYTDTFVFYGLIFLIICFIVSKISSLINDNYVSIIFITLISILFFRCFSYIFIVITGNMNFDFGILFKSIYSSLIINIIYVLILKVIVNKLDKVFRFKKGLRY